MFRLSNRPRICSALSTTKSYSLRRVLKAWRRKLSTIPYQCGSTVFPWRSTSQTRRRWRIRTTWVKNISVSPKIKPIRSRRYRLGTWVSEAITQTPKLRSWPTNWRRSLRNWWGLRTHRLSLPFATIKTKMWWGSSSYLLSCLGCPPRITSSLRWAPINQNS
jgi:hypothetical protein